MVEVMEGTEAVAAVEKEVEVVGMVVAAVVEKEAEAEGMVVAAAEKEV
jgi:hypothetical protein